MNSKQRRQNLRKKLRKNFNFEDINLKIENFPNIDNFFNIFDVSIDIPNYNLQHFIDLINKFYQTNVSLLGVFYFLINENSIKNPEIKILIRKEFESILIEDIENIKVNPSKRDSFYSLVDSILQKESSKFKKIIKQFKEDKNWLNFNNDFGTMYNFLYNFYEKDEKIKF